MRAFDPTMAAESVYGRRGFAIFPISSIRCSAAGSAGFGGGGRQARNGPVAGNDLRYNLTLTFEEAAFGVRKEILIPREETCATCGGTGAKPGTEPERCATCGGTGQVRTQQNTILGSFTSTRPCTNCRGTGKVIKDPCTECKGAGRVRKNTRIVVNVPAGIDNGRPSACAGGEAGTRGGRAGLYIASRAPAQAAVRKGTSVLNMPIPFYG